MNHHSAVGRQPGNNVNGTDVRCGHRQLRRNKYLGRFGVGWPLLGRTPTGNILGRVRTLHHVMNEEWRPDRKPSSEPRPGNQPDTHGRSPGEPMIIFPLVRDELPARIGVSAAPASQLPHQRAAMVRHGRSRYSVVRRETPWGAAPWLPAPAEQPINQGAMRWGNRITRPSAGIRNPAPRTDRDGQSVIVAQDAMPRWSGAIARASG